MVLGATANPVLRWRGLTKILEIPLLHPLELLRPFPPQSHIHLVRQRKPLTLRAHTKARTPPPHRRRTTLLRYPRRPRSTKVLLPHLQLLFKRATSSPAAAAQTPIIICGFCFCCSCCSCSCFFSPCTAEEGTMLKMRR